jgi:hypothetical protein
MESTGGMATAIVAVRGNTVYKVILPRIISPRTRSGYSDVNYQLKDLEVTGGMEFRQKSPAQGC